MDFYVDFLSICTNLNNTLSSKVKQKIRKIAEAIQAQLSDHYTSTDIQRAALLKYS